MGNKSSSKKGGVRGGGGGAGSGSGAGGASDGGGRSGGREPDVFDGSHPVLHAGPVMKASVAAEGRDLFRRFADHLERQTDAAPMLGTPASTGGGRSGGSSSSKAYGRSRDARDFVAQYHWGEPVGAGSYSTVHQVREKRTGRELAVKIIKKELLSPDVQRQIENEARLMLECQGPNIVELVEYKNFGSEYYFVLEFLPSTVLTTVVQENIDDMYSEAIAAHIIRHAAVALNHMHKLGIAHLDVKPDNLLLSTAATPKEALDSHVLPDIKLCDFGMAARSPVRRTVGTLFYVAPEILTEGWADTQADVWSLGVVMYVLLCGFPPFMPARHRSDPSIESKIIAGEYEFFSPYWDHVSPEAMDLVRRMLVVEPETRLTMGEVLRHKWLRTASRRSMPREVHGRLRKFNAKQRWHRGMNAAQTIVRLRAGSSARRAAAYK